MALPGCVVRTPAGPADTGQCRRFGDRVCPHFEHHGRAVLAHVSIRRATRDAPPRMSLSTNLANLRGVELGSSKGQPTPVKTVAGAGHRTVRHTIDVAMSKHGHG